MSLPPTVREATRDDLDALTQLSAQVQALHVAERPDFFKVPRPGPMAAWWRDELRDPDVSVWIAEHSGVVVGYLLMITRERAGNVFCHDRRWCEIDQIAVDAAHHRRGVARALLSHAVADARRRSVDHVELNVWAFNHVAQAAFERAGFRPRTSKLELKA